MREEKYGSQNTKEYSKSELDRLLDEKEENSAAYEKILEERKQAKLAAKEVGAESSANAANVEAAATSEGSIRDKTQFMLLGAKTDLAVRTGRASQKLEEAVSNLKDAAKEADEINNMDAADEELEDVAVADNTAAETAEDNNEKTEDEIVKYFKDIIKQSYGKKSEDGKRFIKDPKDFEEFAQTEAYVNLFMELATNSDAAANFVNGIIPQGLK